MACFVFIDGKQFSLDIVKDDDGDYVSVDRKLHRIDAFEIGESGCLSLVVNDISYDVHLVKQRDAWEVHINGNRFDVAIRHERDVIDEESRDSAAKSDEIMVKSIMRGIVSDVKVKVKDEVAAGDVLLLIESMKMENEVKSKTHGIIKEVYVEKGQIVESGQQLVGISTR